MYAEVSPSLQYSNHALAPDQAIKLLERARIRVIPVYLVAPDAQLPYVEALAVDYPVAVKIAAVDIAHKAAVGGVVLGCRGPDEVIAARDRILADVGANMCSQGRDVVLSGVYVQSMVRGDLEVVLGIQRDPDFGPLVAFGLGGWAVETWADLNFRRPPLRARDVDSILCSTRAGALLSRHTDRFARALQDLRAGIEGLGELALELEDSLIELEANPLVVNAAGAFAVDAIGLTSGSYPNL